MRSSRSPASVHPVRTLVTSESDEFRLALQITLREEPGFSVVASVADLDALVAVATSSRCDVVVIDRPGAELDRVVARLREDTPGTLVVVRTDDPAADPSLLDGIVPVRSDPDALMAVLRRLRTLWTLDDA